MSNYQKQGRGGGRDYDRPQVDHQKMTHYYDDQGLLKREVFIEWPREVVAALDRQKDKRTNLRRAFDHVSALQFRIQMKEGSAESVLGPGIPKLYRFVEYQKQRDVISDQMKTFIQTHCNAVQHDEKKFEGFYQLFQSVLAYLGR